MSEGYLGKTLVPLTSKAEDITWDVYQTDYSLKPDQRVLKPVKSLTLLVWLQLYGSVVRLQPVLILRKRWHWRMWWVIPLLAEQPCTRGSWALQPYWDAAASGSIIRFFPGLLALPARFYGVQALLYEPWKHSDLLWVIFFSEKLKETFFLLIPAE